MNKLIKNPVFFVQARGFLRQANTSDSLQVQENTKKLVDVLLLKEDKNLQSKFTKFRSFFDINIEKEVHPVYLLAFAKSIAENETLEKAEEQLSLCQNSGTIIQFLGEYGLLKSFLTFSPRSKTIILEKLFETYTDPIEHEKIREYLNSDMASLGAPFFLEQAQLPWNLGNQIARIAYFEVQKIFFNKK